MFCLSVMVYDFWFLCCIIVLLFLSVFIFVLIFLSLFSARDETFFAVSRRLYFVNYLWLVFLIICLVFFN